MLPMPLLSRRSETMTDDGGIIRVAVLCGQCNCGCPELFVDQAAPPERRIVITDDFGQRVQMSADQFQALVEQVRSGRLEEEVAALIGG
jgi:hypothetical protein